jgi:hypothetical protein
LGLEERELLVQWLNSIDTQALGLARLQGQQLVKYAGSLTGRDFCAIIQVAPLVLCGLEGLPIEAYEAWLALARLVPLIYQSEIEDIDLYIVCCTFVKLVNTETDIMLRHLLPKLLMIFWHAPHYGRPNGSIRASSMCFYISQNMFVVLDRRSCMPPRASSLTMLSFVFEAYTQAGKPQASI